MINQRKQIENLFKSKEYQEQINNLIKEIGITADAAPNEKTIETRLDQLLTIIFHDNFEQFGYKYSPIKEEDVNTTRAITKGRADTSIGNVVLEFKQPRTLSSKSQKKAALNQAKSYIQGFNAKNLNKTLGIVTDGKIVAIYRFEINHFVTDYYHSINFNDIQILIRALLGFEYKALSSKNLVDDFATSSDSPAKKLAITLYKTLSQSKTQRTQMLQSEWKNLFKLSHNDNSKQLDIEKRRKSLEDIFQEKLNTPNEEYDALFALQTSYTILLKLLAFKILSQEKYDNSLIDFKKLIDSNDTLLQIEMKQIEDGSLIRDYGIQNLLEGDYFSWYSVKQQWNNQIAACVRDMILVLDSYTMTHNIGNKHQVTDLFKELYQAFIPDTVRHSLGEYYTPHWLAKRVINKASQINKEKNWRALDPACGSGTFLTVLINKVIRENKDLEKASLLSKITSSVVGIDINPLAVLTARVNYFLNVADLIGEDTEVEIPVYSGDSAYTPQEESIRGVKFVKYSLDTKIAPFEVNFPKVGLNNLKKFSKVMNEIELDIQGKNNLTVYRRLMSLIPAEFKSNEDIKQSLLELSEKFIEFENRNWNGIWARVIANYLETSEIGKFTYIVGNLPWIDWKSLPTLYRDKIKSLKISKSIFSGDYQTGGINLNIAALITNVVITNWLSSNGVFAMLMPDTFLVQKTYEGFRRLELGDGTHASFVNIDNWRQSGDPFSPVTQKFFTYYIQRKQIDYRNIGIPYSAYILKKGCSSRKEYLDFEDTFNVEHGVFKQLAKESTHFTEISKSQENNYELIGKKKSIYKGREGIEFYPQELFLFDLADCKK